MFCCWANEWICVNANRKSTHDFWRTLKCFRLLCARFVCRERERERDRKTEKLRVRWSFTKCVCAFTYSVPLSDTQLTCDLILTEKWKSHFIQFANSVDFIPLFLLIHSILLFDEWICVIQIFSIFKNGILLIACLAAHDTLQSAIETMSLMDCSSFQFCRIFMRLPISMMTFRPFIYIILVGAVDLTLPAEWNECHKKNYKRITHSVIRIAWSLSNSPKHIFQ